MKRIIIDYKKLTPEILSLLVQKYPDGYDDRDVLVFKNSKKETVEAVEVKTEDTIYLVKISTRLEDTMTKFDVEDYEDEEMEMNFVDLPQKGEDDENED
ncbi:hypothetical protein ES731_02825 [Psychroflexus gondwanensis]|jgi:hypothetical protein|uniref:DNA primase n=1 Tax=Psychroflexus gondwanensis ACAM 44 TaxID=1189619 RepID=N1WWQ7_9FLAO|nr:hypothetical protein [Psychroflexus gondwanensis]EMY81554.1 hypothetical protein pgond44_06875 [Psychroflexus gondwanensis ACAM 44]TXE20978.1 hypothetical protein ES731_02825 [Psychroflexus gondwanensis]